MHHARATAAKNCAGVQSEPLPVPVMCHYRRWVKRDGDRQRVRLRVCKVFIPVMMTEMTLEHHTASSLSTPQGLDSVGFCCWLVKRWGVEFNTCHSQTSFTSSTIPLLVFTPKQGFFLFFVFFTSHRKELRGLIRVLRWTCGRIKWIRREVTLMEMWGGRLWESTSISCQWIIHEVNHEEMHCNKRCHVLQLLYG